MKFFTYQLELLSPEETAKDSSNWLFQKCKILFFDQGRLKDGPFRLQIIIRIITTVKCYSRFYSPKNWEFQLATCDERRLRTPSKSGSRSSRLEVMPIHLIQVIGRIFDKLHFKATQGLLVTDFLILSYGEDGGI
ncbi:hypothetical protein TNCV_3472782 [Trichonephila clavipes]|nr:hypothetical protein TNCV_3472782 [Trichonephila clavipes]